MLGLVLLGTTATLAVASAGIADTMGTVNVEQSQNAMRALDADVSDVAFGRQSTRRVDVGGTSGTYTIRSDAGHITVRHREYDNTTDVVLYESDLGAVAYEHEGTRVVYQMGGIWRRDAGSDRGVMVARPTISYREETLRVPVVRVVGKGSMSSGTLAVRQRTDGSSQVYPNRSATYPDGDLYTNPSHSQGEIVVEIQSEFYRAWGPFLEEELNGSATYDHAAETVTVAISARDIDGGRVSGGVFGAITSPSNSGNLDLRSSVKMDSYDSDEGSYSDTTGANGNVTIGYDVTTSSSVDIEGSVNTSGGVTHTNAGWISGDVAYGTHCTSCSGNIGGDITATGESPSSTVLDGYLEDRVDAIDADNDNAGSQSTLTDIETNNCGSGCTLTAGNYSLKKVTLKSSSSELVLDTTDGPINLALGADAGVGSFYVGGGSDVRVVGDHRVNVYVTNRGPDSMIIDTNGGVHVDSDADGDRDYDATRLWVYGPSDGNTTLGASAGLTAAVYAPRGSSGNRTMTIQKNSEYYGAVVGHVDTIENSAQFHYDEALARTWAFPEDAVGADSQHTTVTYLLMSENEVVVEAD